MPQPYPQLAGHIRNHWHQRPLGVVRRAISRGHSMAAPVALGVDTAHKMSLAEEDDDCDADCARFEIVSPFFGRKVSQKIKI